MWDEVGFFFFDIHSRMPHSRGGEHATAIRRGPPGSSMNHSTMPSAAIYNGGARIAPPAVPNASKSRPSAPMMRRAAASSFDSSHPLLQQPDEQGELAVVQPLEGPDGLAQAHREDGGPPLEALPRLTGPASQP